MKSNVENETQDLESRVRYRKRHAAGVQLSIHPESTLFVPAVVAKNPPKALLYIEAVDMGESNDSSRVMMRHIAPLPAEWLAEDSSDIESSETPSEDTTSVSSSSATTTSLPNGENGPSNFLSRSQKRKLKKAARRAAKRQKLEEKNQEIH